jgi:hypothetical protein
MIDTWGLGLGAWGLGLGAWGLGLGAGRQLIYGANDPNGGAYVNGAKLNNSFFEYPISNKEYPIMKGKKLK